MTHEQKRITPIRRSLILFHVLEPADDDIFKPADDPESFESAQTRYTNVEHTRGHMQNDCDLHPGASLEEIRTWLDAQCEEEQARADWSTEQPCNRINLLDENANLKKGLDTYILDRIQKGYGTQSSRFEDLLWPLRMDSEAPRFFKKPIKQTCQEMESVVRGWNRHVGGVVEDTDAREALIDAMYGRIEHLDGNLSYRRSADAHDITSQKLLHAIHAYRLETVHFSTKDICELMIIMLAHLGHAVPDLDEEVKYLMFHTLVTERQYMSHTANAATARKLSRRIQEAKICQDDESAERHERQMQKWSAAIWQNNSKVLVQRIRTARRNIELRVLKELRQLGVLRAALGFVLHERVGHGAQLAHGLLPRRTWLLEHAESWPVAHSILSEIADARLSDFLVALGIVFDNIADMNDTTHKRILTRAIKFAGLDLPANIAEVDRARIVKMRMEHPGTVGMIADAIEALKETESKSKSTVEVVANMGGSLGDVLRVAESVARKYEEALLLLDVDSLLHIWQS